MKKLIFVMIAAVALAADSPDPKDAQIATLKKELSIAQAQAKIYRDQMQRCQDNMIRATAEQQTATPQQ